MTKSFFLEGFNSYIFVLSLIATFIFAKYLWISRYQGYTYVQPAIALIAIFIGSSISRFAFWWSRHEINSGWPVDWPFVIMGGTIGGFIETLGIFCVIRVFAPNEWGPGSWVWSAMFASAWTAFWLSINMF